MGAVDPTSGTVTLHEVVRGFGALLRSGWKPLRNIVFASWDAEEVRSQLNKMLVYPVELIGVGSTVSLAVPSGQRISLTGYPGTLPHISTLVSPFIDVLASVLPHRGRDRRVCWRLALGGDGVPIPSAPHPRRRARYSTPNGPS